MGDSGTDRRDESDGSDGSNDGRGDGGGSENGDDGGNEDDGENGNDGDSQPSTAEKAVIAVSVAFTALLIAFVLWQAITAAPSGAPHVRVLGTTTMETGDVRVHVEVTNPSSIGLETVIVEANCTTPPPELTVQHVPAGGRETGYLVCPAGTATANVSVAAWQEA